MVSVHECLLLCRLMGNRKKRRWTNLIIRCLLTRVRGRDPLTRLCGQTSVEIDSVTLCFASDPRVYRFDGTRPIAETVN